MRVVAIIAALLALGACGIDGPPSAPGPAAAGPDEPQIGVVGDV